MGCVTVKFCNGKIFNSYKKTLFVKEKCNFFIFTLCNECPLFNDNDFYCTLKYNTALHRDTGNVFRELLGRVDTQKLFISKDCGFIKLEYIHQHSTDLPTKQFLIPKRYRLILKEK